MTKYSLIEAVFVQTTVIFDVTQRATTPAPVEFSSGVRALSTDEFRMTPSPPLLAPIAEHAVHEPSRFHPQDEFTELKVIFKHAHQEMGFDHLDFYDYYKSLLFLLGDLIFAEEKQLVQSLRQKILPMTAATSEELSSLIDANCLPTPEKYNDKLFLSLLVTAYLYHVILEDIYFKKLAVNYDPVAERLFTNGFALYVLLQKNLSYSIRNILLLTYGHPICLLHQNQFKNLKQEHPFRGLRVLDDGMLKYNLWRLTLARFRRFYLSLQLCFHIQNLNWMIALFEPQLRVFMLWLNFLYFLPRVLMDLAHLTYHMVFFPESQFSLKQRAQIFFQRRWESFARDSLWLINGALSLFVFTGPLGFWGLYVSALVQLIEVMLNAVLLIEADSQQLGIRRHLLSILNVAEDKTKTWANKLEQRDLVDHKIRVIRLRNSFGVLLCNTLILPFFLNLHIGIALVGAGLSLVMSVIQFSSMKEFANLRKTLKDPFLTDTTEALMPQTSRYLLYTA